MERISKLLEDWIESANYRQIDAYLAAITYSISLNLYDELYRPSKEDIDRWTLIFDATSLCKDSLQNRHNLEKLLEKFLDCS